MKSFICAAQGVIATGALLGQNALPLPGPVATNWIDVAVQAVAFHPNQAKAYAAQTGSGRLLVLDLAGHTIDSQYSIQRPAGLLTISPGGKWLAAAISPEPETGSTEADVVILDLTQGVLRSPFHVRVLPSGVAITDSGVVVVNDAIPFRVAGYFGLAVSYDGLTGTEQGFIGSPPGTWLTLAGDQQSVYGGEYDMVRLFLLDPTTSQLTFGGLSPQQSFPTAVQYVLHALPDGQHLVSRGGRLHPGIGVGLVLDTANLFESVTADPTNKTFFIIGVNRLDSAQVRLLQYHSETFELAATYIVDPGLRHMHLAGDTLYLVGPETNRTAIQSLSNLALGGGSNTPPVAGFTWTPAAPTTLDAIEFTAVGTQDETPAELWFRWDWDNDGRYDSIWTNSPVAFRRFTVAGSPNVTVQVKDRFGATHQQTRTVTVTQAGDPGIPAAPHTPFQLSFPAKDMAFNPDRPIAYVADLAGKRIVRVNLEDGLAERELLLDKFPQMFGLTPDGSRLYAVLWTALRPLFNSPAYLAEFDLETGVKNREITIDRSIDLLMPAGDQALVAVVNNRELVSYKAADGSRLLSRVISGLPGLVLHPFRTNFYAVSSSSVDRYALDSLTGQFAREGSIQGAQLVSGDLYPFPNGTNILSRLGRLLIYTNDWRTDLRLWKTFHTGVVDAVSIDAPRRAVFFLGTASPLVAGSKTNLYHYHLDSHLPLGTYAVTNGTVYLKAYSNDVFTAAVRNNLTLIERRTNPARGGETNEPPVAAFTLSPASPTTITPVTFDAGGSTDDEAAAGQLQYRWDWEADGVFDTPFGDSPLVSHRFNLAGTWSPVLEVRDRFGATSVAVRPIDVARADDPGQVPAVPNTPFELPFAATDAVFDPARPHLYVTDLSGKRLVRMNLQSGLVDREFVLDNLPNAVAIAGDARTLCLTLLRQPNYSTPPGLHKSFIAYFDLERGVRTHEFPLSTVSHDLVISSLGYGVISTPTPGSAGVRCLRLQDGAELYSGAPFVNLRLAIHPNQSLIYGVTYGSSGISAFRFDLAQDGMLTYAGGVGHNFLSDWIEVLDSGSHFVSGVSGLFTSSTNIAEDRRFVRELESGRIYDSSTDNARDALFVAGQTFDGHPYVRYFSLNSFELAQEIAVPPQTLFVHAAGDSLYYLTVGATASVVTRLANPATGAETNRPPVAVFVHSPGAPRPDAAIQFDATDSMDDQDAGNSLRYRWDWDSDGIYDTPWSPDATLIHAFARSGVKEVTLQVVDRFGEANSIRRRVEVQYRPGQVVQQIELQFAPGDVLFDPRRSVAYASDPARKRIVRVQLATGLIDQELSFVLTPGAIALTPDGTRLVLALVRQRSADQEGSGAVADIDPVTFAIVRQRDLPMDPFDLVVTDAGRIVVTSGSGQWTQVRSFRIDTAEQLGSAPVYYLGRIALHPSQTAVYVATTAVNPPSFTKFGLDPVTGALTVGGSSGSANGEVFPDPNGTRLVTSAGTALRASANPAEDLQLLRQLLEGSLGSVSYDPANGLTFAVGELWGGSGQMLLFQFGGSDLDLNRSTPIGSNVRMVHVSAPFLYTVAYEANRAVIQRWIHPTSEIVLTPLGQAGSSFEVRAAGWPGREIVLEGSPDLIVWLPISTNSIGDGPLLIRDLQPAPAVRFYRARIIQ